MNRSKGALTQGIWGLANTGVIRIITLLAQIVLALLLSPREFGVYAIALSAATVALTLRGAGVLQWQIEGGERHHQDRFVDAFWLSAIWNLILGLCVAVSAIPLARLFHQPTVAVLIAFIGLTFPLQAPSAYFLTRLQIQLRIKELTFIELASMVVRCGIMIGGAAYGFGAFSFVAPIPVCYALEAALGFWVVREAPWRQKPNFRLWPKILKRTSWIVLGTVGAAIGLQGDYVVLGALASITAVGIYYFAYQLTLQAAGLVSTNINRVFTSLLVSAGAELSERQFLKAVRIIMLAGSPGVLLLAAGFAPFERIVWGEKWEASITPVILLSVGLPLYLLSTAIQSALISSGKFKRWMVFNYLKAAAVVGSAVAAGLASPTNATDISAVLAAGIALSHLAQSWWGLRGSPISLRSVWRESWVGIIVGPLALLVSFEILEHVEYSDLVELVLGPTIMVGLYIAALLAVSRGVLLDLYRLARTSH